MSEENVVAIAQKAVGDTDTIIAAAWFQARGTSGGTLAGMEAGDVASDMVGSPAQCSASVALPSATRKAITAAAWSRKPMTAW